MGAIYPIPKSCDWDDHILAGSDFPFTSFSIDSNPIQDGYEASEHCPVYTWIKI